jgi:rhodanese-related sulfurtransferase
MLFEIGSTNPNQKKVLVVDARSKMAAYGNKAKGGGFEIDQYYSNCKLVYGCIENIHSVRDAYKKCFSLCESYHQTKDNKKIQSKIESTGWLNLLKNILIYSAEIAARIHYDKQTVVVHCSDGWDRTAQLCSLAQMMIDPYYRTIEGFEVIIEKEWISFGHKFETRYGHFKDDSHMPDERSPVFIQFLDCVYQLLLQFPTQFQFNNKLLLFLAHHVYTCKFGTFL